MSNTGEEESDAVLSDVEADDEPVPVNISAISNDDVSVEKFRELLAELDREKHLRLSAENAKNDLQVSFNRLKALAHEAIKKRDESNRIKEEASRSVDRLTNDLAEANRAKEEIGKQLEEVVKAKDSSRSEIEAAAQMLVSGIEKISGKASEFKNLASVGLPKSPKYTGLPAVAYGVIKRMNEVVEEVMKARDEAREMMEQRNYEIAIEVSQMEATIEGLREEVSKKSGVIEDLEKVILEKDEVEGELSEKVRLAEEKAEEQRGLVVEQLKIVCRIHDELYNVMKIVDVSELGQSEYSEALFVAQETGLEENIRACLAGLESIHELSRVVVGKARDVVEEKNHEVKSLNEAVARLVREKEQVGVLLRSALSKRLTVGASSKASKLFEVAESGLRDAEIEFKFANPFKDGSVRSSVDEEGVQEGGEDEIYALAGALEDIIKTSQVEISELHHSVDELRAESAVLKEHLEAQAKELTQRRLRIEELEQKERVANENVEGLMMDIAAAEEEIARWKGAAEQEAAAGGAVEQEYLAKISALKQEIEEAKRNMIELEKKMKFKEETAAAAMAARDAAEKSLRLVDARASRLRDRVEELTHQLEEVDTHEDTRNSGSRPRYVCWPWEWLGIDYVGLRRTEPPLQQQGSNEMELSEPLI